MLMLTQDNIPRGHSDHLHWQFMPLRQCSAGEAAIGTLQLSHSRFPLRHDLLRHETMATWHLGYITLRFGSLTSTALKSPGVGYSRSSDGRSIRSGTTGLPGDAATSTS